jgi:hypothetical protein
LFTNFIIFIQENNLFIINFCYSKINIKVIIIIIIIKLFKSLFILIITIFIKSNFITNTILSYFHDILIIFPINFRIFIIIFSYQFRVVITIFTY